MCVYRSIAEHPPLISNVWEATAAAATKKKINRLCFFFCVYFAVMLLAYIVQYVILHDDIHMTFIAFM